LTEFSKAKSTKSSQPTKPPVNLTITRPGEFQQTRYPSQDHAGHHHVSTARSGSGQDYTFEDPVYVMESFSEQGPNSLNPLTATGGRKSYMRQDKRSLILANLSDRTTYQDLVSMIRGGALLDVFIRNDRTASIAFADGIAAQSFLDHARRNDLYIHSKRVSLSSQRSTRSKLIHLD
jgi:hypothetical protein